MLLSQLPSDNGLRQCISHIWTNVACTPKEAFLQLISHYDVPLDVARQLCTGNKIKASFSGVTYRQVAPYTFRDPDRNGDDMKPLHVFASRMPHYVFYGILGDVDLAMSQFGPLQVQENEELFARIVARFGSSVMNKPEGLLESNVTRKGRIEHHFTTFDSVSIVFVEIKRPWTARIWTRKARYWQSVRHSSCHLQEKPDF